MAREERYRLRHAGHDVEVAWVDPGIRSLAPWEVTLSVDGADAATARLALWSRVLLRHADLCVELRRAPTGRLAACDLLDPPPPAQSPTAGHGPGATTRDGATEDGTASTRPGASTGRPERAAEGTGAGRRRPVPLALRPTPGSRAERRYLWRQRHPRTYASRHVVRELFAMAAGILGIGALLRGLLPRIRIDLPDLSLPRIHPPHLPLPRLPMPRLPDLPDLPVPPHWLVVLVVTAKWWVPVLLAVGAAAREVRVVRKRQARDAPGPDPAHGPGGQPCAPSTPNATPHGDDGSSRPRPPASPRRGTSGRRPPTSAPGPE